MREAEETKQKPRSGLRVLQKNHNEEFKMDEIGITSLRGQHQYMRKPKLETIKR